ncbi:MAG: TPM domain-containing protein [Lysobacteraceae bacterium]
MIASMIPRWFRHRLSISAHRVFPEASLSRIADAIARDEARHRGEVCFAVESALDTAALWRGEDARDRAATAFAALNVWDTVENNGILIYLLLADRRIEILADRGLDGLVSNEQWRGVCLLMEERLRAGDAEDAVQQGVAAAGDLLAEHFPLIDGHPSDGREDRNELPDRPRILG